MMTAAGPAIAQTIQLSVAPVFLLVAMGSLLNVYSGRLARVVDRSRVLMEHHAETRGTEHQLLVGELRALDRRMRVINQSMLFAVGSGVVVCLLVALLFLQYVAGFELGIAASAAFVLSMFLILLSLGCFLVEVRLAIHDIRVPMELLERE